MTTLKKFLTDLADNPEKLGNFIHDPEKAMKTAGLSPEDQAALRSGFPGVIYARLAGLSVEKAFRMLTQPSKSKVRPFYPFYPDFPNRLLKPPPKTIMPPDLRAYYKFPPPTFWWGKLSGPTKAKTKLKANSKSKGKPKRKLKK